MDIIGMQKSSFVDYPGKICTIVFTSGCNFRCPYCHNSSAVNSMGDKIKEDEIINYLKKRKKFVDALCISGGEPTLQKGLFEFILKVKKEGFFVKLDTNGTNPKVLRKLIENNLLDYVAMDIKAPLDKYPSITETFVDLKDIQKSINILLENKVEYEFRTTICKELLNKEDIMEIAKAIKECKTYAIQNFKDGETILAGQNKFTSYDIEELKEIEKSISVLLDNVVIR